MWGEFQNKNHLSLPVLVRLLEGGGDGVRRKLRDGESPPCPGSALPRSSGVFGLSPALRGSGSGGRGYIRRAVLAGASLAAVLRGRGSLSVFVLLLLHLLHDFPDLALGGLGWGARNGGRHSREEPPPSTTASQPHSF